MAQHTEHYDSLGVAPDATPDQIKAAYKRKARSAHPDAGGKREEWDRVSKAVTLLLNPEARARYDASGDETPQADLTSQAMTVIDSTVMAFIASPLDLDTLDLIAMVRDQIVKKRAEFHQKRAAAKKDQKRLRKLAKRVKRKGGDNLIGRMIEKHASDLEGAIKSADQIIEVAEIALKLVDGHTYELPTENRPANPYGSASTNARSGSLFLGMFPST